MPERQRLIPGFHRILHGGDYNPDQWQKEPGILDEDYRLMKLAGTNTFAVGIFAWTSYEPEEGTFTFDWLDRTMDRMAEAGQKVILATPSGAKPAWMARKYPEIRRVDRQGRREPYEGRHNHCWSSPVYRRKVETINRKLAERYGRHPALGMWHLSNEYSGECHCELCHAWFRRWLEARYGTVEALNDAWWASFWSHDYKSFEDVEPRDGAVDTLAVDFRRFNTDQVIAFIRHEMAPLRALTPNVPCTTNFMGLFSGFDYARVAEELDLVADDQYPAYDGTDPEAWRVAIEVSFKNDLHRAMKPGRPWMLMESCPEAPQWKQPMRAKRPNVHRAEMLQALAHGAEGTCYFQFRKGRGGCEKFHGAVVDHVGHEHTRAFQAVADLGRSYERLAVILGSEVRAKVAIVYDWEAHWGFDRSEGPDKRNHAYDRVCREHYRPFWQAGISVDVIASTRDFTSYDLLITPQLWMLKPGVAERIRAFVEQGGTWVATLYTGYCDEANRCFLGGFPGGGLAQLLGIWNEEWDVLGDGVSRLMRTLPGNPLGLNGTLEAREVVEVIHARGCTVLVEYAEDYYAGMPALTVNASGKGKAYYVPARYDEASLASFYGALIGRLGLKRNLSVELPLGVTAQRRVSDEREFVFLVNFTPKTQLIELGARHFESLLDGRDVTGPLELAPFGSEVLARGVDVRPSQA
jgi:beta-galactosidase